MGNCDPVRKGHEADAGCAFLVTINFKDHVERLFPYFIRTCAIRESTTRLTFQLFDNLFYGIVVAPVTELIRPEDLPSGLFHRLGIAFAHLVT